MRILKLLQAVRSGLLGAVVVLGGASSMVAATWFPLGPYGGDARTIAADPQDSRHLLLGTTIGWIYESKDGGASWARLSHVGKRDDLVLDHILIDPASPQHLTVAGWVIDRPDGGLFESVDGGQTWYAQAEMKGQSVRALAAAPSNPKMMVAGTLKGVYQSMDAGKHWQLISPEGSAEIHEIESIAIDPVDTNIIYAGTWHLPWKTFDGGKTWTNMKDGILDDSDVFSIIIDPKSTKTIYLSACSGIYKSTTQGVHFDRVRKDQLGMDHAAIRTRKLMQDPERPQIVFAGTTQGLWRTTDNSKSWSRVTGMETIVNDVFIDPKNTQRVLLATDRSGVLVSEDGGVTFKASNTGFTARQVTSFAADRQHPGTIYVGVVNDKDAGGVFMSTDGGVQWQQQSNALNGRDVYSLASANDGTLLAGTGHGIFRLEGGAWAQSGMLPVVAAPAPLAPPAVKKPVARKAVGKAAVKAPVKPKAVLVPLPPPVLDAAVYALAVAPEAIYAGTSQGLMKSTADGRMWNAVDTLKMAETRLVAAQKSVVMVANMKEISVSTDDGKDWESVALPADLTRVASVAVDDTGTLWIGGREGVYYSDDSGKNWKTLRNLFTTEVTGVYFDAEGHRVLVTSLSNTVTFGAHVPDHKVSYWDSGWELRFVRPVGDHLVGATMYDGMVVQPVMVESKVAEK